MKIKNHKIILHMILGIFFFLNLFMFFNFNKFGWTTAPDFVQNEYFSNIFARDFKMEICYDWLNEVANIYWSRWLRITTDECVSHWSMHWFIVLEWIFKAINYNLKYLMIPLFNLILLIFTYKITFLLYNNKNTALLAIVMTWLSASVLYFSNLFFNTIPTVAMALGFIYFLLKFKKSNNIKYLIVWLIFFWISVWIRYPIILFLIPMFLLIFWTKKKIQSLIIILILWLIFAFPLIKTNIDLFWNITWNWWESLASVSYYSKNVSGTEWWINLKSFIDYKIFWFNIYNHFIEIYFILFLYLIFYILNISKQNKYSNIILFIIILNFYFYFIEVWWWYDLLNTISTSYSRYTLLWLILLIIILSESIRKYKKIWIVILTFWLISNINLGINWFDSYAQWLETQKKSVLKKQIFLANYPEKNAIIYTSYFDKYFFPDRIAWIYTTFPEKTRLKDTAVSIKKLLKKNIPVYMIESDWAKNYDIFKWDDYKKEILKQWIIIEWKKPIFKFKLNNEKN